MKKYLRLFLVIALSVCLLLTDGILGGVLLPDSTGASADAPAEKKEANYVLDDDYTASSEDCEELAKGINLDLGGKVLDLANNKATTAENAGAIVISNGTLKNASEFFGSVTNSVTLSNVVFAGNETVTFSGDVTFEDTQIGEVEIADEDKVSYDGTSFFASQLNVSVDAKSVVGNLYVNKTANITINGFVANLILLDDATYSYVEIGNNANIGNIYVYNAEHVYINASRDSFVENAYGNSAVWSLMTPTVYVEEVDDDTIEEMLEALPTYAYVSCEYATCLQNGEIVLSADGENETFVVKAKHCYGEKVLVEGANSHFETYDAQCIYCGHMRRTIGENSFTLADCENWLDVLALYYKDFNYDITLQQGAKLGDFVINGGYIHILCDDGIISAGVVADVVVPYTSDGEVLDDNLLVKFFIYDQDVYFYGSTELEGEVEELAETFNIHTFICETIETTINENFNLNNIISNLLGVDHVELDEGTVDSALALTLGVYKALLEADAILDTSVYDFSTMVQATLGLVNYLIPCDEFLEEVNELSLFKAGEPDEDGNITYTLDTTNLVDFLDEFGTSTFKHLLDYDLYPVEKGETKTSEKIINFITNIPNLTIGDILDAIVEFCEANGVSEEDIFDMINTLIKTVCEEVGMESLFTENLRGDVRSLLDATLYNDTLNDILGVIYSEPIYSDGEGSEVIGTTKYELKDILTTDAIEDILKVTPEQVVNAVFGDKAFENFLKEIDMENISKYIEFSYTENANCNLTDATLVIVDLGTINLTQTWEELEIVNTGDEEPEEEGAIYGEPAMATLGEEDLGEEELDENIEEEFITNVNPERITSSVLTIDIDESEVIWSDAEKTVKSEEYLYTYDLVVASTYEYEETEEDVVTLGNYAITLEDTATTIIYSDGEVDVVEKTGVETIHYFVEFASENDLYYFKEYTHNEEQHDDYANGTTRQGRDDRFTIKGDRVVLNGEKQYVLLGVSYTVSSNNIPEMVLTVDTEKVVLSDAERYIVSEVLYKKYLTQSVTYDRGTSPAGKLVSVIHYTAEVDEELDEILFNFKAEEGVDVYDYPITFHLVKDRKVADATEDEISPISLYHADLSYPNVSRYDKTGTFITLSFEQTPVLAKEAVEAQEATEESEAVEAQDAIYLAETISEFKLTNNKNVESPTSDGEAVSYITIAYTSEVSDKYDEPTLLGNTVIDFVNSDGENDYATMLNITVTDTDVDESVQTNVEVSYTYAKNGAPISTLYFLYETEVIEGAEEYTVKPHVVLNYHAETGHGVYEDIQLVIEYEYNEESGFVLGTRAFTLYMYPYNRRAIDINFYMNDVADYYEVEKEEEDSGTASEYAAKLDTGGLPGFDEDEEEKGLLNPEKEMVKIYKTYTEWGFSYDKRYYLNLDSALSDTMVNNASILTIEVQCQPELTTEGKIDKVYTAHWFDGWHDDDVLAVIAKHNCDERIDFTFVDYEDKNTPDTFELVYTNEKSYIDYDRMIDVIVHYDEITSETYTFKKEVTTFTGASAIDDYGVAGWDINKLYQEYFYSFGLDDNEEYYYREELYKKSTWDLSIGANRVVFKEGLEDYRYYTGETTTVNNYWRNNYFNIGKGVTISVILNAPITNYQNINHIEITFLFDFIYYNKMDVDELGRERFFDASVIYDSTDYPTLIVTYNESSYSDTLYETTNENTALYRNRYVTYRDANNNLVAKGVISGLSIYIDYQDTLEAKFTMHKKYYKTTKYQDGTFYQVVDDEYIAECPLIFVEIDTQNGIELTVKEFISIQEGTNIFNDLGGFSSSYYIQKLPVFIELANAVNNGEYAWNVYKLYCVNTETGYDLGASAKMKLSTGSIVSDDAGYEEIEDALYNEGSVDLIITTTENHFGIKLHVDLESVLARIHTSFSSDEYITTQADLEDLVETLFSIIESYPAYPCDLFTFTVDKDIDEETGDWTWATKFELANEDSENSYGLVVEKIGDKYDVSYKYCQETYLAFTLIMNENHFEFIPTYYDGTNLSYEDFRIVLDNTDGVYTVEYHDNGEYVILSWGDTFANIMIDVGVIELPGLSMDFASTNNKVLPVTSFFEGLVAEDFEVVHGVLLEGKS